MYALYGLAVRLVRREQLAVVAAVDPFLSGLLGLAVARATKRPLLVRISGNADDVFHDAGALAMPHLFPTYAIQQAVTRFVLKRADLVSAINENNRDYALANGAREAVIIPISGSIEHIHLHDPAERIGGNALRKVLDLPGDRRVLLYFGRLIDLKHPDDALRAMAVAIRQVPETVGVIAGEGEMEPALKALACDLGVTESIRFPGLLDQDQLSLLIPNAIVLAPSAGQMAILEAALGGAAIVAYACDFQSEFVENGGNGFLVARRDWQVMGDRLVALLDDEARCARLGAAARADALDHMSPERVREAELSAFSRLLPSLARSAHEDG
jgi:glycosyltransferase involved in cell wall biosynthesis